MDITILLLDCSSRLEERLGRQGFDVASGTIGYTTGVRRLPGPVYEYDIIIYNPKTDTGMKEGGDRTPEYDLEPLLNHINRGATLLVFVNHVSDNLSRLKAVYEWIPNMPEIFSTKDFKLVSPRNVYTDPYEPLLAEQELKIPVLQKVLPGPNMVADSLFMNKQGDDLGVLCQAEEGRLIVLPEYTNNDYVISVFLNRVLPRFYRQPSRRDIIDRFTSPVEEKAKASVQKIETERKALDARIEEAKEKLALGTRLKKKTIKEDDTAGRVIRYYDLAVQQEDVALFYLYKVIEAIEKKFGGEKTAKGVLGHNAEWNLIGKVANASYGDIRHAPKPGEKIKAWNQDEIAQCFSATERIICGYFNTLF